MSSSSIQALKSSETWFRVSAVILASLLIALAGRVRYLRRAKAKSDFPKVPTISGGARKWWGERQRIHEWMKGSNATEATLRVLRVIAAVGCMSLSTRTEPLDHSTILAEGGKPG